MKYVQCPQDWYPSGKEIGLFLAGGISNCSPWQSLLANMLKNLDLTVVNPRREIFNLEDVNLAEKQIEWEHFHLRRCHLISFWFCEETLCPITLFELGYWLNRGKVLFVGVHPNYKRRLDVETQVSLADPSIKIAYTLEDLADQIKES